MENTTNIHNTSDIGITCPCGTCFTGENTYFKELLEMYNKHICYIRLSLPVDKEDAIKGLK